MDCTLRPDCAIIDFQQFAKRAARAKVDASLSSVMPDFDLPDSMALRPTRKPVVNTAEFRSAMSSVASSVSVVTARRGDEVVGRTVTAVLSLSASPPSVLISIDIVSRLADLIAKTGGFSMAVLAEDQSEIADAFAGKVVPEERFDRGTWSRWPSGQPMLDGAVTVIDCEVIGSIETGTHVLFAGAIIEAEAHDERRPLIWQRHGYHGISSID
ncbi:flavin reductase family protein [Devosia riboflavina]